MCAAGPDRRSPRRARPPRTVQVVAPPRRPAPRVVRRQRGGRCVLRAVPAADRRGKSSGRRASTRRLRAWRPSVAPAPARRRRQCTPAWWGPPARRATAPGVDRKWVPARAPHRSAPREARPSAGRRRPRMRTAPRRASMPQPAAARRHKRWLARGLLKSGPARRCLDRPRGLPPGAGPGRGRPGWLRVRPQRWQLAPRLWRR